MTVGELIRILADYPQDVEVFIEGEHPRDKPITGADWNVAGQRTWVTITDFHE